MSDDDFIHDPVETGFELLTATVSEPVELTAEGREALKVLAGMKEDFASPSFLAQVARDVAMDIETVDAIISRHGLNHAQYDFISKHNEFFKKTLLQQSAEWQKIGSTQDRLKAQAAAALEAQLPTLAGRMGKQSEKLAEVVEAAKLFAKIAGVDAVPQGPGRSGERFEINIDLGADERLTIRSSPIIEGSAEPAGASHLPQIPKAA